MVVKLLNGMSTEKHYRMTVYTVTCARTITPPDVVFFSMQYETELRIATKRRKNGKKGRTCSLFFFRIRLTEGARFASFFSPHII